MIKARARATRCCSPPESCHTLASVCGPKPKRCNMSTAWARARARPWPCSTKPKATLSCTLRCGNSAKSWNRRPHWRRCGGKAEMSLPSRKTCPASGTSSPAMIFSSVLLPLPEGPRTATVSPAATCTSRPRKRMRDTPRVGFQVLQMARNSSMHTLRARCFTPGPLQQHKHRQGQGHQGTGQHQRRVIA